jgi:hypothetical protein
MTAMRTAARSKGDGTATPVLAARRIARQLGNPMPALWRAVRSSERLLSIATALLDTAPDPYPALRRLLQAETGLARSSARHKRDATRAAPGMPRSATVRELHAAPARVRATEVARPVRNTATAPRAQPEITQSKKATSEKTRSEATPAENKDGSAAQVSAVVRSRTESPCAPKSFSTDPQRAPLRNDSTSSLVPTLDAATTLSVPRAAASHELVAQRRRRLRDGLERRTETALPAASSDVPTIATLAALLGSMPPASARPHSLTTTAEAHRIAHAAITQRPSMSAPTAATDAERITATPVSGMLAPRVPPAAPPSARPRAVRPSRNSDGADGSSVRHLLPPSSPLDACGDIPANTLLDAAYRHGVDPT